MSESNKGQNYNAEEEEKVIIYKIIFHIDKVNEREIVKWIAAYFRHSILSLSFHIVAVDLLRYFTNIIFNLSWWRRWSEEWEVSSLLNRLIILSTIFPPHSLTRSLTIHASKKQSRRKKKNSFCLLSLWHQNTTITIERDFLENFTLIWSDLLLLIIYIFSVLCWLLPLLRHLSQLTSFACSFSETASCPMSVR